MKLTRDAHFTLVVLLGSLGAVAVAHWEAEAHPAKVQASPRGSPPLPEQVTGQGAALRDGLGVDPNRASASELELLPSVGPSLAKRIVEDRAAHGPFRSPQDLRRVKGVGAKTLLKLLPFLHFPASEAVEHAADAQLNLGLGLKRVAGHEQHAGAKVEADGPGAVEQKVEP